MAAYVSKYGENAAADKALARATQNYKQSPEAAQAQAEAFLNSRIAAERQAELASAASALGDAASSAAAPVQGGTAGTPAASAASTASAGATGSENFRYIPEPKQSKPEEINTQVVNTVTPNLENQQAGLAALRSTNILSRLSRDEFTFSSNRLGNIAGYCTYLKNASSEKGLYSAKIKDAKTL